MINRYSVLAGLLAPAAAGPLSIRSGYNGTTNGTTNGTMAQSFKDVPISSNLQYTPCFQNFTCANIEVPLDYDNPDAGTTNIAFLKYESPKQPAIGDLIFNPGGPGESAVGFFLTNLELLTDLVGDSFNLIGMDPRGVNHSGPNLECFEGTPAIRDYFDSQLFSVDARNEASVKKYYEESGAFGTWCSRTLNESANYANTPATAQDMLRYFELLAESQGQPREEALVNYFGGSYGSSLGTTFASLYPERVGRFIIDAVVDVEDYYFGNWSQNILQADEAIEAFFRLCVEAGPNCALYQNGSTVESIKQRVDSVLQDLEDAPVPVTDPYFVQFPTSVTHMDLRTQLLTTAYSPPATYSRLALTIAELENRNGSLLAVDSSKGLMSSAECDNASPEYSAVHPKLLIACNDLNHRFDGSLESLSKLWDQERQISTYIGDVWPPIIVPQCRNLNFTPPENQIFKGEKDSNQA